MKRRLTRDALPPRERWAETDAGINVTELMTKYGLDAFIPDVLCESAELEAGAITNHRSPIVVVVIQAESEPRKAEVILGFTALIGGLTWAIVSNFGHLKEFFSWI